MKVIPYTRLSSAVPALMLVAVNATVMFGPAVQLAALIFVLALVWREIGLRLSLSSVALIAYIALALGFAVHQFGGHQAVLKAGKLAVFCVASVLVVRGSDEDKTFSSLFALRAFFGLCTLNFGYAFLLGGPVFRADHFIEYSIYSSYTIAILVFLARPRLRVFDRCAAWGFAMLCGSTTGLLVLILAELPGRKLNIRMAAAMAVFALLGFIALGFLMEARGKEFSWDYLENSDRGVLIATFFNTLVPDFSGGDWLFGLGAGVQLHQFNTPDSGFDSYLLRLGEGEVYAFCLHNELLRILCDFGVVGVVLVALRLWVNCSLPLLIMLCVCMMTNSYLYSFSGALIASGLFGSGLRSSHSHARTESRQTAGKPNLSLAHA